MIRTQIQLPEKEHQQLRDIAARERRSIADCIREGVRLFLHRSGSGEQGLAKVATFRPLSTADLKVHDQWLADAALERRKVRKNLRDGRQ